MANMLGKTTDRIGAGAGAVSFSQIPNYIQSYFMQLYGHLAELQYQLDRIKDAAAQNGKTLQQFIEKFLSSTDPDYKVEGELMQAMVDRSNNLAENMYALQAANVWEQPFVFFKTVDWSIATATLNNYELALPLNSDGVIYSGIGLIIGFVIIKFFRNILWAITYPFTRIFRRKPRGGS